MRTGLLTAAILVAMMVTPAHADPADSLVKAFIGVCVQVMPNVDRIELSESSWLERN